MKYSSPSTNKKNYWAPSRKEKCNTWVMWWEVKYEIGTTPHNGRQSTGEKINKKTPELMAKRFKEMVWPLICRNPSCCSFQSYNCHLDRQPSAGEGVIRRRKRFALFLSFWESPANIFSFDRCQKCIRVKKLHLNSENKNMQVIVLYFILFRSYDTPKPENVIFQTLISAKQLNINIQSNWWSMLG